MDKVIIVLPVHNEAKYIEQTVKKIYPIASSYGALVVIAEDGSTDGSDHICKSLSLTYPNLLLFHSDHKLGRGRALKKVYSQVKGDIYIYLDADLATNMQAFHRLITAVKSGFDLATGSRYVSGAKVYRPPLRLLVSLIYNFFIRVMFKSRICDHQCGFKAFSNRFVNSLLPQSQSDDWFWDTEIIVLAASNGLRICEFPVTWVENRHKNTPIKRLINDIVIHGRGLLKLWLRLRKARAHSMPYLRKLRQNKVRPDLTVLHHRK